MTHDHGCTANPCTCGFVPIGLMQAEIATLRASLAAAEREVERLRSMVGHAGWVGGMVLGICEGAPGWESVKEYPAGPEVEAWGSPSIAAAKALMRRALAAERARDEAVAALREMSVAVGEAMLANLGDLPKHGPVITAAFFRARAVLEGK